MFEITKQFVTLTNQSSAVDYCEFVIIDQSHPVPRALRYGSVRAPAILPPGKQAPWVYLTLSADGERGLQRPPPLVGGRKKALCVVFPSSRSSKDTRLSPASAWRAAWGLGISLHGALA